VDDFFHFSGCRPSGVASATINGPSRRKDHDVDTQQSLKFNEDNIVEFRASGGRIASFGDAPLLLLTTPGAKSGRRRTSPMMYLADEHDSDRVYVFASAAGDDHHPAWFHNVVAHPADLEVELGDARYQATAEVVPEPRRTEVYAIQAGLYPGFAEYQAMTSRVIPVVALILQR
jgi:deazaflavin-dependent oxidoreductase (nitroreductase family)